MRTTITRSENGIIDGRWYASREECRLNDRERLCDLVSADVLGDTTGRVEIYHAGGWAITDDMPSEGEFLAFVEP